MARDQYTNIRNARNPTFFLFQAQREKMSDYGRYGYSCIGHEPYQTLGKIFQDKEKLGPDVTAYFCRRTLIAFSMKDCRFGNDGTVLVSPKVDAR